MMRSLLFFLLLTISIPSLAIEAITSFDTEIEVLENGELLVTEHITVNAEGRKIKRGIYRDFPTRYRDHRNNHYNVEFHIEAVLRNGKPEAWHTKTLDNGVRIYFGRKDKLLKHDKHKYSFSYRTNRQLGFFDKHDELYWNVTGNDWDFPINKASARVTLPDNITADKIQVEGYTGKQGDKGSDYYAEVRGDSQAFFETTRRLPRKHGLTIVAAFPKGFVIEPSSEQKMQWLFEDNRQLIYLIVGIVILLIYYWLMWMMVGRDPEGGVIIARYTPPEGYSPASMRFIDKKGYDNDCFTAALVNLAVKGYLNIEEDDDDYYLRKQEPNDIKLAPGEAALVRSLFSATKSVKVTQSNHKRFRDTQAAHEASLKQNYEKIYFLNNSGSFIIGILLTLLILVISFTAEGNNVQPISLFLLLWTSIWTFGLVMIFKTVWIRLQSAKHGLINLISAVFTMAFALPFIAIEIDVLKELIEMTSHTLAGLLLLTVLINWLFYELLKAPTRAGRELLDKVEGFRHYIEVAERNELESKYAPKKTPERFEEYLPYAMALGLETKWANIFTGAFADLERQGQSYSPRWYRGTHWNPTRLGSFTSGMSSSLGSAIASSSIAPGSSSGGGGGGFSGGGGGGGGGGGW